MSRLALTGFSIVIPLHNREREIHRAVASCVQESEADFEVIVVDDGSTDGVYVPVDSRVRVIRHERNRGAGSARNTGADAATGEWVVFLDSDDELLPGALALISRDLERMGLGVDRLAYVYQRDDGRTSPFPAPEDGAMDYRGYLASLEGRVLFDFLPCTRRSTLERVRYMEGPWVDHCLYDMDFAREFRTWFRATAAGVVHTGAGNRTSLLRREKGRALRNADELGEYFDTLLERHGEALRESAPLTFQKYLRMRASYHFLAGHRREGLGLAAGCLRATPLLPEAWLLMLLGFGSRSLFATVRGWRGPAT